MNARTLLRATTLGFVLFAGGYAYWTNKDNPEPDVVAEVPTTGTLTLRLEDAAGQPPLDCGATLAKTTDRGYELKESSTLRCPTGELSWAGLAPGEYRLTAAGEGTVLIERRFEIPAGTTDLGTITLAPGGHVAGVVTADGEPVVGAMIYSKTGQKGGSVAGGEYVVRGLPAGPAELVAGFEDRGAAVVVDVIPGQVVDLDLELEVIPPKGVFGVQFDPGPQGLTVTKVHPLGPMAYVAAGTVLISIDGQSLAGLSREDAEALLAGAPGSQAVIDFGDASHTLERVDLQSLQ